MNTVNLMNAAIAADPTDATARLAIADAITEEVGTGFVGYCPEMGESKPLAHIEARLGHYGNHYFIDTPLTLKGRGIEYIGTETDSRSRRAGWNKYKVTLNAMDKLEDKYRVSQEEILS